MTNDNTGQPVTRRQALGLAAGAVGTLLAAPMLNLGRFRLYASSTVEYSARCLKLMQESTVLDMLGSDFQLSDGIWTCGKDGQSVPVNVGTPTVRIAAITVGGTQA